MLTSPSQQSSQDRRTLRQGHHPGQGGTYLNSDNIPLSPPAPNNNNNPLPRQALRTKKPRTNPLKKIFRRISRAKAATANGFETLGLYAAGVVAGNAAGVPTQRMNTLALTYVASRVLYNYVYVVLQDNSRLAVLRPLVWGVGITVIMMLFVAAGKALN